MPPGRPFRVRGVDDSLAAHLSGALGIHPVAGRILASRGISTADAARRFLAPSLSDLIPPFDQTDVEKAARRLARAVTLGEKVVVHGDYDVDGVTSTVLLTRFLRSLGVPCSFRVPDRLGQGYGLSIEAVRDAAASGARVLVTVDCGIASFDEVALAGSLGMDVIVVDHHPVVGGRLPTALAVINAEREDCGFAGRVLAAVGATFNLVVGLRQVLREEGLFGRKGGGREPTLRSYLDLVALGTVADMVPLTGQNRVLARHGLEEMARSLRPGIQALLQVAGCRTPLDTWSVAFQLGPRINAAGRLGDATRAVRLLATDDPAEAHALARELDAENRRRQDLVESTYREALAEVETGIHDGRSVLLLARRGWHPGVLGIVAARLLEVVGRPVAVVGIGPDGIGRGSARSVPGIDIGRVLLACGALLEAAGGHAAAAGLAVRQDRIEAVRDAMCAVVDRARTGQTDAMVPGEGDALVADAEVSLADVTPGLVDDLRLMEPFGRGNDEPVLLARRLRLQDVRVVKDRHIRCSLRDGRGLRFGAVGFGLATSAPREGTMVDAAFVPRWNDHGRSRTLELTLKDLRPEE